ncbi:S100 calcium binding protein U [Xyrauchen texanus]|uniref:S100 calcium binding protein U n=1 Tax=Xyrauchen texanus TaxID=154827 RepID=UPI002241A781|nr:S100 calcium binding protein U [Xyrauchen texanus]
MEAAVKTVVGVFLKSSKGKENLGSKDFQKLVKNNLNNIMTGTENNDEIKGMCKDLDNNQDGKVNFQEYMKLIGYLAQSLSDKRCSDQEAQAESSSQKAQAEAAAVPIKAEPQQAEPKAAKEEETKQELVAKEEETKQELVAKEEETKQEPVAKEEETKQEPVAKVAAIEEQKPKEENKTNVEQEAATVEEKNKTGEAS